jgi:hypothetical protein
LNRHQLYERQKTTLLGSKLNNIGREKIMEETIWEHNLKNGNTGNDFE